MDKYIGKRLDGRYEIRELIGVGGMAYVYKAYDTIDDRIVAVKILKDEYLANEEFTRRFKNESKAIAILSHPNIVKVYDVSFGDRLQYIVMEYIDGITLKEYIDQQKDIRWKEAVHFTVQILRALQHAHDKGIVHRDIKPQNIMLLPDGTIKVTDFGIARFARSEIRATSTEEKAIGSVHYISPEQARGEITDEKADIYSVGVMLYEMLTGRLPFEADNAVSVAIMQMQAEPKHPSEVNPDIPEGLEEITLKAMQKDPAKRYQSAAEMLYDIDEFKRNPSIHFEYKYFVDETPTRFVEAITRVKGNEPETEEDGGEEEPGEEQAHKGPPVIPILAAVAGAFVLVALLFVGAVALLKLNSGEDKEEILVPNFIGQMYDDVVKEYGDKLDIKRIEQSSDEDAGTILDQSPKGPTTRKYKDTVTLTISTGPQMVEVPALGINESKDVVEQRLRDKGFDVQIFEQPSDEVAAGLVIKLSPSPGDKAAKGSTVSMFVSTGEEPVEPVEVPNVEKALLSSAKATLQEKGFVVNDANIQYQNSTDPNNLLPENYVVSQDPAPGEKLEPGQEVKLVVSSGYCDVSIEVGLPQPNDINSAALINVQVVVDNQTRSDMSLSGILASGAESPTFTFTEQKDSYEVAILVGEDGKGLSTYRKYQINGKTGQVTQIYSGDFVFEEDKEQPNNPSDTTDPTNSGDSGHAGSLFDSWFR
ncbi:MAG TPA: Stk1 family PASTA domain-containing Ser/Thr kinase [Firmicutes bacterium]|nr:Stk1 family PASTA domain-containing Ser/Thr kinase [Bacillota bacterium]